MKENEILERINEVLSYVSDENKEACSAAISRLLMTKGEAVMEDFDFFTRESDIIDSYDDDTYYIREYDNFMRYSTKGGYHIFCAKGLQSCAGAIKQMADVMRSLDKLDEEQAENLSLAVMAELYVLQAPLFAFVDTETMFKISTCIVNELSKYLEKSENADLEAEDHQANAEFEGFAKSLEKEDGVDMPLSI